MLPERLQRWATPTKVLDHGSITLMDIMGDDADAAVLQAARTSTGASSKSPEDNRRLLRYLFRHRHATPFEACQIKIHVKLPIFVERQWVRHRASGLNEASARYSILPDEQYIPDPSVRPMAQSRSNKQGSEDGDVDARAFVDTLREYSQDQYQQYLNEADAGIAKEVARLHMTVGQYTEKVWWCNLRMLLHFLGLRKHPHAQWEIRQYADVIWNIVEDWAPWTAEAFRDYELEAHTFSRQEMELLRAWLTHPDAFVAGAPTALGRRSMADEHDLGTPRERKAFWAALGLLED